MLTVATLRNRLVRPKTRLPPRLQKGAKDAVRLRETSGDGPARGRSRTALDDGNRIFLLAFQLKGGHNPQGGAPLYEPS